MQVSFGFRTPLSTNLLNLASKDVLPAGVYLAPTISVGAAKTIIVSPPWVVRSVEGMTVREENAPLTVSFATDPDGLYYVGVLSQYVVGGQVQVSVQRVSQSIYNASWTNLQKASFVILCEVGVVGSTLTIRQLDRQTQPRGTFALQVDMLDSLSKSTISRVGQWGDLETLLAGPTIATNRLFYVGDKHHLAIFNGTSFERVNPIYSGSGVFLDAPEAGPNQGVSIALPADFPSTATSSYAVAITPTTDSDGHLGNIWVEKGKLGLATNLNYFTVKCSGRPSLSGLTATFDYLLLPR